MLEQELTGENEEPYSEPPTKIAKISGKGTSFPAGLRVLVVDDDPLCLMILDRMLRQCSYEVTTCNRATTALSMLREKPDDFDVVISDVHMPDMDGFKLLELIGLEMDLPVIMMSANGETSAVMKGVTHGACDYLLKPVRIEELKNIWQHVVRKRTRELQKDSAESPAEQDDRDVTRGNGDGSKRAGKDLFEGEADGGSGKQKKDGGVGGQGPSSQQLVTIGGDGGEETTTLKKARVVWSIELHQQFVNAVNKLGVDKAVPKRILEIMNVQGLTRENVASHLQKYRLYLKRLSGVNPQPHPVASFTAAEGSMFGGSLQVHQGGGARSASKAPSTGLSPAGAQPSSSLSSRALAGGLSSGGAGAGAGGLGLNVGLGGVSVSSMNSLLSAAGLSGMGALNLPPGSGSAATGGGLDATTLATLAQLQVLQQRPGSQAGGAAPTSLAALAGLGGSGDMSSAAVAAAAASLLGTSALGGAGALAGGLGGGGGDGGRSSGQPSAASMGLQGLSPYELSLLLQVQQDTAARQRLQGSDNASGVGAGGAGGGLGTDALAGLGGLTGSGLGALSGSTLASVGLGGGGGAYNNNSLQGLGALWNASSGAGGRSGGGAGGAGAGMGGGAVPDLAALRASIAGGMPGDVGGYVDSGVDPLSPDRAALLGGADLGGAAGLGGRGGAGVSDVALLNQLMSQHVGRGGSIAH